MLKEVAKVDNTTLLNFAKYKILMFTMTKIIEMGRIERNKIV